MDIILEQQFIKKFIDNRLLKRLIFEFSISKHRFKAISRFANAEKILKKENILIKSNKMLIDEVEQNIRKLNRIQEKVYIISMANEFDGTTMELSKALQICFDSYMPTIIICSNNLAFVKGEQEEGAAIKYILYKKE